MSVKKSEKGFAVFKAFHLVDGVGEGGVFGASWPAAPGFRSVVTCREYEGVGTRQARFRARTREARERGEVAATTPRLNSMDSVILCGGSA